MKTICEETKIGNLCGSPVIAVTDDAGSNIIIGGSEHTHWLVSPDFENHKLAVMNALVLVANGELPDNYTDMRGPDAESRSWGFLMMAFCRTSKSRSEW